MKVLLRNAISKAKSLSHALCEVNNVTLLICLLYGKINSEDIVSKFYVLRLISPHPMLIRLNYQITTVCSVIMQVTVVAKISVATTPFWKGQPLSRHIAHSEQLYAELLQYSGT